MIDQNKPKAQLIEELKKLRIQLARSEQHNMEIATTKAKNTLIQSKSSYSTLVESIPLGIQVTDVFGNILFGNTAYHKQYGYPVGELIGKSIFDLISTEEKKEETRNHLVFLVNNQPPPTPLIGKNITKQGKIIDIEVAWNYKRDQAGQVIGFISIINDITYQLKREQELLMANEQLNVYKTLVDYIPHIIWTGNSEGQVTFLNKAWKKWTGREIEESLGTKWLESVHPDDADSLLKKWENAYSGGNPYQGDCRFVHQNGQMTHCSFIGIPIKGADKKVKFWAGIDYDITDLKKTQTELYESQAKTTALLNAISESALLLDSQGTVLELNKAAAQRLGKTPGEIIGQNAYALFPKKLAESRFKIASEVFDSGKPIHNKDKRGDRFLSNTIYPVFNKDGKVDKLAIYSRDITKEIEAEKILKRSHDKLEKLVEERTKRLKKTATVMQKEMEERKLAEEKLRALAIRNENIREEERTYISREIHDELGHSLTALLFDLHSLRNEPKFQNNKLEKELKSMIGLVNHSIKTIQKIASDLRPGILDKLGISAAIEWQFNEFHRRTEIECNLDIDGEHHLEELSKEKITAIFRIFQEILTNITRHANAKKVNVILKADNNKARLFVSDDGIGFKQENIDSLGILGIRERVNMIGGDFLISSPNQGGTEVNVLIPIIN